MDGDGRRYKVMHLAGWLLLCLHRGSGTSLSQLNRKAILTGMAMSFCKCRGSHKDQIISFIYAWH